MSVIKELYDKFIRKTKIDLLDLAIDMGGILTALLFLYFIKNFGY
jgi:hypothetical protein